MAARIVKKEVMNDEIKEFGEDAATAINELLGLYGYDDEHKRNELSVKFQRNSCKKIANISQKLMESKQQQSSTTQRDGSDSESLRMAKMNDYSSISSDKDSSSREDSPLMAKSIDKAQENNCSWCHQLLQSSSQSNEIIGSSGAVFCSENCFLFWRRASFKRAKTCDFCKNVRNAVSYVDFNDGTIQLQFCSDKCLNQYKMQIFCRETQAQLELNPHLKDNKSEAAEHLITPELWLKNCRTRSPTPDQEQQQQHHAEQSPSPMSLMSAVMDDKVMKRLQIKQPPPSSSSMSAAKITSSVVNLTHTSNANNNNNDNSREGTKKPLINVLPSSKLLSRNILHHKNLRKRRVSARLALSSSSAGNGSTNGRKVNQNASAGIASSERVMNTNFPADLRAKIHTQMSNGSKVGGGGGIQSSSFNRPPPTSLPQQPPHSPLMQQQQQQQPNVPLHQFMQRPPINLFKFRLPFPMSPHNHHHYHQQQRMQHLPPPEDSNLNLLQPTTNSLLPPPVVLVPYPIPLPIILPIPLPLTAFMRAYQTKGSCETSMNANDNESREAPTTTTTAAAAVKKDMRTSEVEQPLDLSSEQGVCCDIDKDFVTPIQLYHNNNNTSNANNNNNNKNEAAPSTDDDDNDADEENDDDDDGRIRSEKVRLILGNKNGGGVAVAESTLDKIPKFEISRVGNHQHAHHVKEDTSSCESNRPLRKRKIIATTAEEVSESQ